MAILRAMLIFDFTEQPLVVNGVNEKHIRPVAMLYREFVANSINKVQHNLYLPDSN